VKEVEFTCYPDEYGQEYQGVYRVRSLAWKYAREVLRKSVKSKDEAGYVEDLILASVTGPVEMNTREQLETLPAGLVRRLMDLTLQLNDVGKVETTFLSSSATPAALLSQKTQA